MILLRLSFGTLVAVCMAFAAPTVRADELVTLCKKNNERHATLRVIEPPATCRPNETEITLLADAAGRPPGNTGLFKVTNVEIDGSGDQAKVDPGASFTVEFDYNALVPGCPNCIMQRYVGISSESGPQSCQDDVAGAPPGDTGDDTHTLTAPTTPGIYYIAIDHDLQFDCFDPGPQWPNGTPSTNDHIIGSIAVY